MEQGAAASSRSRISARIRRSSTSRRRPSCMSLAWRRGFRWPAPPRPAGATRRGVESYRPTVQGPDGVHFVRLFDRMHGRLGGAELDDDAVRGFATTHARLSLALRRFFHPAAGRELLWDLKRAAELRPLLASIADKPRRRLVADVIDRFEQHVVPPGPLLPSQVGPGGFTLD